MRIHPIVIWMLPGILVAFGIAWMVDPEAVVNLFHLGVH
jgi:hypothetical protein